MERPPSPHRLDSFLFYVIEWQHKFIALMIHSYFSYWQPAAAEPSAPPMTNDCNYSKITDEESSDHEDSYDDRRLEDAFYSRS